MWTGDDWINVEVLNERTGILQESSVNQEFGYKDLVLINLEETEILQVIDKRSRTIFLSYETSMYDSLKEMVNAFEKIWNYFKEKRLYIKRDVPGLFLLSIPVSMEETQVEDLVKNCPVECSFVTCEEDFEDDEDGGVFHLN